MSASHLHQDVKSKKSYGIHCASCPRTAEDVNEPAKLLVDEAKRQNPAASAVELIEVGQTSVYLPIVRSTPDTSKSEAAKEKAMDEPLPESKLGTKQYWDSVYAREINNFQEIGEEGEVWFGEGAVTRMAKFLERFYTETETRFSSHENPPTILDLGTGNGHLLFEMIESSADLENVVSANRMVGVDYSEASIKLARAIGQKRRGECEKVTFLTSHLLDPAQLVELNKVPTQQLNATEQKWDLVCDKGTMDAIALSSQPVRGQAPVDVYTNAVAQLVKKGGIFLITSCNFTEQELIDRFTKLGLVIQSVIPTPTFTFGGANGSSTTTIAFRQP